MKAKGMSKTFFCAVILALLVAVPKFAFAQNLGIALDSSIITIDSEPGKNESFSFSVQNLTDSEQIVQIDVANISIGDDNVISFLSSSGGEENKLVVFDKNDFPLGAREKAQIQGILNMPAEKIGILQMLILVSFKSNQQDSDLNTTGPKIGGNVGVYLFANDGSVNNKQGKIEDVRMKRWIKEKEPVQVRYRNVGDLYFASRGKAFIKNVFSKKTQEVPFEKHAVFPTRKIDFVATLTDVSPFGVYQVRADFIDGNGDQQSKTFFAFGIYFPIVLTAFVSALVLIGLFIRKNRRDNYEKKEKIE